MSNAWNGTLMMAIAISVDVTLDVRQHPQNALVTPENKEKSKAFRCAVSLLAAAYTDRETARKPIDPPPIVQLKVNSDRQRFVSHALPTESVALTVGIATGWSTHSSL